MSKIRVKSKCDQVMDLIIEDIKNGVYKPGDRMPSETMLSEHFGVSRITIRECFKKLSVLNIVSIRQGEGTFVGSMEPHSFMKVLFPMLRFEEDSIKELYDARECLEQGIVVLAVKNAKRSDIERLEHELELQAEALKNRDEYRYTELDTQFHKIIADISGNLILKTTLGIVRDMVSECIIRVSKSTLGMDVSYLKHTQLVRCFKTKSSAEAAEIMSDHIAISRDLLFEQLGIQ